MSHRRRPSPAIRPSAERLEPRSLLATFLVTNAADAGPGTLRQAILDANAAAGPDEVDFAIGTGPQTIRPLSPLPAVVAGQTLTIDGKTQPGTGASPRITLDGSSAGSGATGLEIDADNGLVRGLAIGNFGGVGIYIQGNNNAVVACVVGADPAGTTPRPNNEGIRVQGPVFLNRIGGPSPGDGNVLSGNTTNGVVIYGGSGSLVAGNLIGVDASGRVALPNGDRGVLLYGGANSNRIGEASAAYRNIISGNAHSGVDIEGPGATNNLVAANYIGTDITGTAAVPNGVSGVDLGGGASANLIGSATPGGGNVLSGNAVSGLSFYGLGTSGNLARNNLIGLDATGRAALPNAGGVTIFGGASANIVGDGSPSGRNVISGNAHDGVNLIDATTTGNFVQGDYIGTDIGGTAAVPNGYRGVILYQGATGNTIGGAIGSTGNLIAGNGAEGVSVSSAGVGNVVSGNRIGVDRTGAAALPNRGGGITVLSTLQTVIGGPAATAGNVLSGNGAAGLLVRASPSTKVLGNLIGLDAAGGTAIGNAGDGIDVDQSSDNTTIGDLNDADRNVVSGNLGTGVVVRSSTGVLVYGNRIGSDLGGTRAIGNVGAVGSPGYGLALFEAKKTDVHNNEIVANGRGAAGGGGVLVSEATPGLNSLYQDLIGTDRAGDPGLGNGGPGIAFRFTGSRNPLLQGDSVAQCTVTANAGAGIAVTGDGDANSQNNAIFGNAGIAIDLGNDGLTPNHPGGLLPGPNGLVNYPVLAAARSGADRTIVTGTVQTAPGAVAFLQFYAVGTPDPSDHGGVSTGLILGQGPTAVADATGVATFRASLRGSLRPGQLITALTQAGGSSEYALNVAVTAAPGSLGSSTLADFDGDGKSDLALYRPTTGQWLIQPSSLAPSATAFGAPNVDVPVNGDFDGDGKADLAVYRPTTGQWLIRLSGGGSTVVAFGQPGVDIPVPADFDGDGKADLAVYRPTTGQWLISRSTAGAQVVAFGGPGDQPVAGDFDGDGKADIAVYRKSTGQWLILGSTSGPRAVAFGGPNLDVPVPADYDGDGTTDLAVYRPTTSEWLIRQSTAGVRVVAFGGAGLDRPVPGDYDGDGKADIAVYRRSTGQWLILQSTAGPRLVAFGQPVVDVPIASPLAYTYPGNVHAFSVQTPSRVAANPRKTAVAAVSARGVAHRPAGHHGRFGRGPV